MKFLDIDKLIYSSTKQLTNSLDCIKIYIMNCLDGSIEDLVAKFQDENKDIITVFGGDGALVSKWRELEGPKGKHKMLFPVRNYGMCPEHEDIYKKFLAGTEDAQSLKMSLMPLIEARYPGKDVQSSVKALAEVTLVSADPTQAIRFNVKINGHLAAENVIANGVIIATKFGSTGYFKSVARTIFVDGLGVGYICPSYSVPNIVARMDSRIEVELIRRAPIILTADKLKKDLGEVEKGFKLEVCSACENVPVLGYEHFMCPVCRKGRNSTVINDNYFVV